jgi:hypothetical protein
MGHVVGVGAFAGGGCNAAENEARTAKLSDARPPEDDVPRRPHVRAPSGAVVISRKFSRMR